MEILNSTLEIINGLSNKLKALVLVILIAVAGFLAYTQMNAPSEETPASAVTKTIGVGDVSGGVQGGFNISQ